ncbi:MAG TPA: hypothetical protein VJZ03_04320, partial [Candidatus Bathyarchaeia archaeon]|nr:hypothetical protein [Candidatus Bathyarchaeia archaeon]
GSPIASLFTAYKPTTGDEYWNVQSVETTSMVTAEFLVALTVKHVGILKTENYNTTAHYVRNNEVNGEGLQP